MTWPELVSPWLGIGLSLMMEISLSVEAVCPSAIHSAMQITFVALYAKLLKIKVSATFCSLSVVVLLDCRQDQICWCATAWRGPIERRCPRSGAGVGERDLAGARGGNRFQLVFHLCSPMATPDGILRRPGFVMTSCIAGNIIGNRRSSPRRAGKIERRFEVVVNYTIGILGFCDDYIMTITTCFLSLPARSDEMAVITEGGSLTIFCDHKRTSSLIQ
uniref:Uncharacterized protein n=1 Tax=Oryza sativa subsp. japonica TaxID=39947 RepID=Q2R3A9_ORYSJ|nr:hypothetical protein LOC_Os11g32570 [Oryza sativa Japonica Group]